MSPLWQYKTYQYFFTLNCFVMLMRMVELSEYAPLGVKVENGKLFIGSHEVREPRFVQGDKIGALYVIRRLEDGYWMFVTGLDLDRGLLWLGPVDVKMGRERVSLPSGWYGSIEAVEKVLNEFCEETISQPWAIFEEGCNTPEEEEEQRKMDDAMWSFED